MYVRSACTQMAWNEINMEQLTNINMALSNILRCYSQQPQAQSQCQPMGRDYDLREVDFHDPAPGLKGSLGQSYAVIGWEM